MQKFFTVFPLIVLLCGCQLRWEDPRAEAAVDVYTALMQKKLPEPVTFSHAVAVAPPEIRADLRREFANLRCWRELSSIYRTLPQKDKYNHAVLSAELARINLNVLLGVPPGRQLEYDTAGAFAVPAELPALSRIEKAAMVTAGNGMSVEFLGRLHREYAIAVAAYDRAEHASDPAEKILCARDKVLGCVEIARCAGLSFPDPESVESAARRFDAFTSR